MKIEITVIFSCVIQLCSTIMGAKKVETQYKTEHDQQEEWGDHARDNNDRRVFALPSKRRHVWINITNARIKIKTKALGQPKNGLEI